ncbi:MAG: hypothetical protein LCI03_03380 [Actinobacteria bacterium]|jgi:hypothetical protein|nr:hypothetical protein [Actinomycetota bacterium]
MHDVGSWVRAFDAAPLAPLRRPTGPPSHYPCELADAVLWYAGEPDPEPDARTCGVAGCSRPAVLLLPSGWVCDIASEPSRPGHEPQSEQLGLRFPLALGIGGYLWSRCTLRVYVAALGVAPCPRHPDAPSTSLVRWTPRKLHPRDDLACAQCEDSFDRAGLEHHFLALFDLDARRWPTLPLPPGLHRPDPTRVLALPPPRT